MTEVLVLAIRLQQLSGQGAGLGIISAPEFAYRETVERQSLAAR